MDTQLSIEQQVASRISTGIGACTRAVFYPDGKNILYAGTFKLTNLRTIVAENPCPQKMCSTQNERADAVLNRFLHSHDMMQLTTCYDIKPCNSNHPLSGRQFTWELFPSYDIFEVNQYGNVLRQLTDSLGYDAESAISPDGSKIVFTSMRSGDPEIWIMNSDGSDPVQLTHERGYDGGASFSPDGKKIVFRASRPTTELEIEEYDKMLSYNLVSPLKMEIYTMNVDGTNMRQITDFGASSWGATYMYDSKRIIFTSNYEHVGRCGIFHIYMIEEETRHIEQVEKFQIVA
ncbi:unnamed protein product [Anisakis simplex]|uniref:WD40-like Beta Propeller Repeat n=1 Tax=Anisakis simplex TaxID=6269 RepID=A0A0M3KBV3_ANISI|nr:unnamed protein product [Anisakis simplex]